MNEIKKRSTADQFQFAVDDQKTLLTWYKANHRDLPWRKNRDPYRIWISETMLQQTTTTAVLRFYTRFLERFSNIESLAAASIEDVYELWAGLGYYSRARNLHKAAKAIVAMGGFARTHTELLELPGFGPYTSRAVSSLAFSEPVGVLDGNVIRVLSRKLAMPVEWWRTQERAKLQLKVDQFVASGPSHQLNQALMELGSQICTPQNPHCLICPWMKTCKAFAAKKALQLPLKKPRRKSEVWFWSPHICIKNRKIKLQKNTYAPFLKNAWFLPGKIELKTSRPQRYDLRHTITHHEIYVHIERNSAKINTRAKAESEEMWVSLDELKRYVPTSLVRKTVAYALDEKFK